MGCRARVCFGGLVLAGLVAAGCGGHAGGSGSGVTVPWQRAVADDAGRTLRIGFETDTCTKVEAARVEEDQRRVTVTLLAPDRDPDEFCILVVAPGCVSVELEEPLAGRRVVDGAAGRRASPRKRPPLSRYGECRPVPVER